jgi:hypothetical protein
MTTVKVIKSKPLNIASLQPETQPKEDINMATNQKSTELNTPAKLEDKIELLRKLQAEIEQESVKEFENDVNYIVARAKAHGKTLTNYVAALIKLMGAEETKSMYANLLNAAKAVGVATPLKERAARGSKPAREYVDKDSTGARPEVGKTYVLNGVEWVKQSKGATKKEFLEVIKAGTKWEDLLKK